MNYATTTGSHYVLTEDDLTEGRNRLGMPVAHIPLDVPLCSSCDGVIEDGACHDCELIHTDLLPELQRTGTGGHWL
jgi:hypothetical protein